MTWVLAARFIDRIGKGIRGAPRDALVADITPPEMRGAAYGLRQSLDTVGAFAGPLLAIALMLVWAGDFRTVFWFAVIPAFCAWRCWSRRARAGRTARDGKAASPIHWRTLRRTEPRLLVGGGRSAAVFTLARFSEAFLILRARSTACRTATRRWCWS